MPNEKNSHLFLFIPVFLQKTNGNVPLENMDEDEAPLPEFEEMDGNKFFEQMDQDNKVAQSDQINNGGDDAGEEGQVLHRPTNLSVIKNLTLLMLLVCRALFVFSLCVFFLYLYLVLLYSL